MYVYLNSLSFVVVMLKPFCHGQPPGATPGLRQGRLEAMPLGSDAARSDAARSDAAWKRCRLEAKDDQRATMQKRPEEPADRSRSGGQQPTKQKWFVGRPLGVPTPNDTKNLVLVDVSQDLCLARRAAAYRKGRALARLRTQHAACSRVVTHTHYVM